MTIQYLDSKRIRGVTQSLPVKDAQANTHTSSSGTTLTNSSFTVASNSNRILIVCAYRYSSGGDISGITWNGSEAFTRAKFQNGSTETGRTEIWYLVNPTATTASVVTTWDASSTRRGVGVYSFYNVKQTSPIGVTADDDGTATVTTSTITPTTAGSMIVDVIGSGSNGAPVDTLTAGWTQLIGGDDRIHSSQYNLTPTISSANTMAWTFASDKGVNWIAVEVKAFAGVDDKATLATALVGMGSDANGTNNGATHSTTSPPVGSGWLDFDGSNDYFQANGAADACTTVGTISVWFHSDDVSANNGGRLFEFGDGTGEFLASINSSGKIEFAMVHTSGGGQWDGGTDNSSVADNTWYHLVITQDGTSPKVWLGALGSAITDQTNGVSGDSDETAWFEASWNALKIGENQAGSGGRLNGGIAEFACWNVVLTNSQISDLHNSSGNGVSASTIPVGLRVLFNFDVNGEVDNKALSGGISDLPENTLFEETDTRMTYWLQSAVWENMLPDIFSTATGWSGDTSTWAYNSTVNGMGCETTTVGEAVAKTIKTLGVADKWVVRFKLTRNSGDGGDGVMFNIGSSSASTSTLVRMQADAYPYGIHMYVANGGDMYFAAHNASLSWDGSSNDTGDNIGVGDTKYIEIQHHSATSATIKIHDSADYSDTPTSQTRTWSGQSLDYNDVGLGTKWATSEKDFDYEDWQVKIGVDSF